MRLVDLDDAAGLELAWMELRHRFTIRNIDPPLREAILRRCEQLDANVAGPILNQLDELHPDLVLEAHFMELVPNTPSVGFFRKHSTAAK